MAAEVGPLPQDGIPLLGGINRLHLEYALGAAFEHPHAGARAIRSRARAAAQLSRKMQGVRIRFACRSDPTTARQLPAGCELT